VPYRPQSRVQLVDQRDPRGDVHVHDFGVAHAVEVLDQGAEAVAVGDDSDLAAANDLGRNRGAPVRQESRDGVFEALVSGSSDSARPA